MDKKKETVAVIPAYQPSEGLIGLAMRISGSGYRVIVVDDGSGEGYEYIWEALRNMRRVRVLYHDVNRGKGAALKTAFEYIQWAGLDMNYIVTMDADGQHLVGDMEKVCRACWEEPDKLILGSREFGKDVPFKSGMGNKITRVIFRMVSGTKVRDTQTGLRAFHRIQLPDMLSVDGDRYEYEMNVLLSCRKNEIAIREVPIHTVYLDETNSCSHFHPVRDAIRIYGNILKFASASFISFLADYLLFIMFLPLLSGFSYGLVISNVAARILSAILNYSLNAKAVFRDDQPIAKTLPKYIALALFILGANSVILSFFVDLLGIYPQLAKIMTEMILFILSFTVQTLFIFRKGNDETAGPAMLPEPRK